MKYRFIAIEGNIGAGKTTLAQQLAAHYNGQLLLEQFAENPFLPLFYEHKAQHALAVELSFLTDRYEQLQSAFRQSTSSLMIADYTIFKSQLFARTNLNEIEYALYQRIHDLIRTTLPKPDLFIYLHTPVERLQRQIRKRGRPYEQHISDHYLEEIQEAYATYLNQEKEHVLWIENSYLDLNDPQHFNRLVQYLESDSSLPGKLLDI